jgi:uncharacterized protein (TIGR02271 family)
MRWTRNDVHDGMSVTSTKGDRLGKVISRGTETFVVEKGVFFPKDYELRYDHITDMGGGGISYSLSDFESRLGLMESGRDKAASRAASASPSAASAAAARASAEAASARSSELSSGTTTSREEVRIPLMEEEIGIEKVSRETGHVLIHKTIKTEEKHFSVPVTREDIVIERVAVSSDQPTLPSESAFKEQTLDVALHEEDIKVSKRPRLREQMVVRTVVEAIQKEAAADLRHEECEIEDTRSGSSKSAGWSGSPSSSDLGGYGGGYSAPSRH